MIATTSSNVGPYSITSLSVSQILKPYDRISDTICFSIAIRKTVLPSVPFVYPFFPKEILHKGSFFSMLNSTDTLLDLKIFHRSHIHLDA